ncbi:MAG: ADP-ribosyl-[dinitrogen reductase] hydrolase [Gammaproteobacteria bacterium]
MIDESILDKALGAYLGFACGDALGATVEFMTPRRIRERYGIHRDIVGGGWLHLEPGQITDDTQMSLALGQAVIDKQGWDLASVADRFVAWFDGNPPDVGNTCRRGIERYRHNGSLEGPVRDDEAGNGACMRNLPVVLANLNSPDRFSAWTLEQCHITHNNPLSDAAALALGDMTRRLILGEDMLAVDQVVEALIGQYSEFTYTPYSGKASGYIVHTVQTVLHYFFDADTFEECLIGVVNQGDDADTNGALAGMLAGARYGLRQIPARWLDSLDNDVATRIRVQTEMLIRIGFDLDGFQFAD